MMGCKKQAHEHKEEMAEKGKTFLQILRCRDI